MALDWGTILSGAIDIAQGQAVGGGRATGNALNFAAGPLPGLGGPALPAQVTVDTRTGEVKPCRRRRRRKLLTESDFDCLLRIASLPNKENVRIALAKAL